VVDSGYPKVTTCGRTVAGDDQWHKYACMQRKTVEEVDTHSGSEYDLGDQHGTEVMFDWRSHKKFS